MSQSQLELQFVEMIEEHNLTSGLVAEYKFNPNRRWKLDFAWPDKKIAIEIEGGIWNQGRHTRPLGFLKDCEKYNNACLLGWQVFRISVPHLKNGYADKLLEHISINETSILHLSKDWVSKASYKARQLQNA